MRALLFASALALVSANGVDLVQTSCGSTCWAKNTCNSDGSTTTHSGMW